MPFKSKAQQRFMFASEAEGELPKGTAKRWANETEKKKGGIEALPEKVKPMKKSAAEIAEKVCTPEEKAKCCKGENTKKDEKKDEKKSEGNPFAKKEAGCSSSSSKPKKMKKSPKEIANKVWSSKKK
jgi:hypothetical protein